jgi:threonyl-tRNA synthetase
MHGLLRVRGFTQDDAHLFVTPDQMEEEIAEVLRFSLHMLKSFGFSDIAAYLSTRPEKAVGDPKRWDDATEALRRAIEKEGLSYEVDEGGGAFYGPKIDLKIKDAIGREWQLSTVQFDFNEPERFDMTFVDRDGTEKRPYMIHRALLGSLERFFGVLIEHYAGAFPPWLAPEQIKVIPVSDAYDEYAKSVVSELKKAGLRASGDYSDNRMNAKIRTAQNLKIPYMVILGEREKENNEVSVRYRTGRQENSITLGSFIKQVQATVAAKAQLS